MHFRLFLLSLALAAGSASASTVASWNNAALDAGSNQTIGAATGTGTISRGGGIAYAANANAHSSTGWPTGGIGGQPSFSNDFVQIAVNAAGFYDIILSFSDQRSGSGPTSEQVWYSTNGGASFVRAATFATGTSVATRTVNLASVPAANNNSNLIFRIAAGNATNAAGALHLSSVAITAGPQVVSIARADANPLTAATANFTVTFTEPVSGVAAGNFSVAATGGAAGTVAAVTGSGAIWNVQVANITGNGALGCSLNANLSSIRNAALQALGAGFSAGEVYTVQRPILSVAGFVLTGGNGDQSFNVSECNNLSLTLANAGNAGATNVTAVLSSATPGVFLTQPASAFPDIASGSSQVNSLDFAVSTTTGFNVLSPIAFVLTVTANGETFVANFASTVPAATLHRFDSSPSAPIPDHKATTDFPIAVTGLASETLSNVTVSFNATHSRDGDLEISLVSPDNLVTSLIKRRGGNGQNFGSNCSPDSLRTTLDDNAPTRIGGPKTGEAAYPKPTAPFIGTYKPEQPLATYRGKTGSALNGTWKLRIKDKKKKQVGALHCWSLNLSTIPSSPAGAVCPSTPVADVSIAKTAGPPVLSNGDTITYTLTVTNAGPNTAHDVVVIDPLANEIDITTVTTTQGTAGEDNGLVTVNVGAVAAGQTVEVAITGIVNDSGLIENTATVLASEQDSNLGNNAAAYDVNVGSIADVAVTMSDLSDPVAPGGALQYAIGVTNKGPDDAFNVLMTQTLPVGAAFSSAVSTSGTAVHSSGVVAAAIGRLQAGEFTTVTVNVTPTACGSITSTATLSNPDGDINSADNVAVEATTVQSPPPGISIGLPAPAVANAGPVDFPVVYTGGHNFDLRAADITLVADKTAAGTVSVVGGDTASPIVRISSISGQGALSIVVAPGRATACGGLVDAGAGPSAPVLVDNVAPTVSLFTSAPDPTNAVITVTATTSGNTTDFTAADVTADNAAVVNFAGAGSIYSFVLIPLSNGAVSADVAAGAFHDPAGNANMASNSVNRTFASTGPTIALSSAAPDPATTSPIPVTVTVSADTADFTSGDIAATNAVVANFAGSGGSYSFDLMPAAEGLVTANVAAGAFHDGAANPNSASNLFHRVLDSSGPLMLLSSAAPDPTSGVIAVTATASESTTDFTAGDVTAINAAVTGFTGSGSNYSFVLVPGVPGNVSADVVEGAFHDAGGNPNRASNTLSRTYVYGGPTVALTSLAPDPTNASPIHVTAALSAPTTDFTAGDVATTNAAVSNFSGSGASYAFDLTPSGQGEVAAIVGAGAFHDPAANANAGSNAFTRVFDTVQPEVQSVAGADSCHVDITFNEANGMGAEALLPAMYFIDGPGQGTVGANPDTVIDLGGNKFRLGWFTGNMVVGSSYTMTAASGAGGIHDAAGNQLNPGVNTRSDTAVPATLTVFQVE